MTSAVDHLREVRSDARRARIVLAAAIGVFVAQCWVITAAIPVSHEELSVHAAPPLLELKIDDGVARVVDGCAQSSPIVFTGVRPTVVLCAGGMAWPVMIMEYMSGMLYWPYQLLRPLHHGDPVSMRRTTLSVGVATLIALFLLVERLGDSRRAAATALVAAVLPLFLIPQSMLVLFELVPPLLVICAALVVARRPDPESPPSVRRAAIAGALVGLAVLGNIKAAVLATPLLAFALFESPVLRRTPRRAWIAAAIAAAIACSPIAIAALADPQHRFSGEVSARFSIAAGRLDPRLLAAEVFYLLVMTVDPRYFLDGGLWMWTLIIPACALVYSVAALVRAVRRRPHDRVAAACGALQLFYLVFVWLAYDQIHTNYAPIVCAQAASIGCLIAAVAERMGGRQRSWGIGFAMAAAVTVASLLPNTYRRGSPRDLPISINSDAERAMGEHLQRSPGPPVVVTSYNLAGLPDAFSGTPAIRLEEALSGCQRESEPERCERDVVIATIKAVPGSRFLVPLRTTPMDEPPARRMTSTMADAARVMGASLREEARFETRQGVPVLALVAVEGAPSQQSHPPAAVRE